MLHIFYNNVWFIARCILQKKLLTITSLCRFWVDACQQLTRLWCNNLGKSLVANDCSSSHLCTWVFNPTAYRFRFKGSWNMQMTDMMPTFHGQLLLWFQQFDKAGQGFTQAIRHRYVAHFITRCLISFSWKSDNCSSVIKQLMAGMGTQCLSTSGANS